MSLHTKRARPENFDMRHDARPKTDSEVSIGTFSAERIGYRSL